MLWAKESHARRLYWPFRNYCYMGDTQPRLLLSPKGEEHTICLEGSPPSGYGIAQPDTSPPRFSHGNSFPGQRVRSAVIGAFSEPYFARRRHTKTGVQTRLLIWFTSGILIYLLTEVDLWFCFIWYYFPRKMTDLPKCTKAFELNNGKLSSETFRIVI